MKKKNMFRKVLALILISVSVFLSITPIYAAKTDFPKTDNTKPIGKVESSMGKIWGTVTTIVQILAFAAMLFAGLRYMFSSADQKADIKSGLAVLVLGSILVFASATVVKFVVGAAKEVI